MAADSTLPPPLPRSPGGSLLDDDGNWRLKRPALIHGAEEEARTVAHLQTTVHGLAEQMVLVAVLHAFLCLYCVCSKYCSSQPGQTNPSHPQQDLGPREGDNIYLKLI
jgi:hypothetical protein